MSRKGRNIRNCYQGSEDSQNKEITGDELTLNVPVTVSPQMNCRMSGAARCCPFIKLRSHFNRRVNLLTALACSVQP